MWENNRLTHLKLEVRKLEGVYSRLRRYAEDNSLLV